MLPRHLSYLMGETLGAGYFLLAKSRRKALRSNLAAVLGTAAGHGPSGADCRRLDAVGRQVMVNFGRGVAETFMLPYLSREELAGMVSLQGKENLDRALQAGRGVLFATAHLGSWELAGAALAAMGYPITTVAGIQFSPSLSPMIRRMNEKLGITTVSMGTGGLKMSRALRQGGVVALHIDGDQFGDGATVEFFGREVVWPRGPAALALATGSALLPAFAVRTSRRHITIMIEDDVSGTGDVRDVTQRVAGVVEEYVRRFPDQWCMFRPIWENRK